MIQGLTLAFEDERRSTMSKLLVIGCGGVASVAIQKCCQNFETFPELCIASRTVSKCDALKAKLEAAGTPVKITTMTVNADDVEDLKRVIRAYQIGRASCRERV